MSAAALALLLAAPAQASRFNATEETVCRTAAWVVIGRATDVGQSFVNSQGRVASRYLRDVRFTTEAVVHGEPSPTFTLRVTASALPGETGFHSFDPRLKSGARYLLVLTFRPDSFGNPDEERLGLGFHHELSPRGTLPPDDLLSAIWSEHCDAPPGALASLRPTEPFLEFIPAWALAWCKHYEPVER